jgi:hypothetical protein
MRSKTGTDLEAGMIAIYHLECYIVSFPTRARGAPSSGWERRNPHMTYAMRLGYEAERTWLGSNARSTTDLAAVGPRRSGTIGSLPLARYHELVNPEVVSAEIHRKSRRLEVPRAVSCTRRKIGIAAWRAESIEQASKAEDG